MFKCCKNRWIDLNLAYPHEVLENKHKDKFLKFPNRIKDNLPKYKNSTEIIFLEILDAKRWPNTLKHLRKNNFQSKLLLSYYKQM